MTLNDKELALFQSLIDKATDCKSTPDDITKVIDFARTLSHETRTRTMITKENNPQEWEKIRTLIGPREKPEHYIPDEMLKSVVGIANKVETKLQILQVLQAFALIAVMGDKDFPGTSAGDMKYGAQQILYTAARLPQITNNIPAAISIGDHAPIPWKKVKKSIGSFGGKELIPDELLLHMIEVFERTRNAVQRKQLIRTIDLLTLWQSKDLEA